MSAFLVECEAGAYNKLSGISPRYPDIHIKTYPGDFLKVFLEVLRDILSTAFAFFFIDPKGWRIPLRALTKMLERRNSEVVFNFMFDFINRAANIKDPAVIAGLDELIPYGNWRVQLEEAERCRATSDERKEILVDAFSQSLTKLGAYHFVAETTILRPLSDRPLYCLCYATRHPKGIEVFRDCQIQALEEQAKTRAERKVKHTEAITGQREIFQSLHDMAPNELEMFLETERAKAKHTLLSLAPLAPESIVYDAAWPRVLAKHVVRKPDVNRSAAQLRQANQLNFLDWEKSKRVPQGHYKMQRLQTRS
jgi:three-Cys-motif partner protein